ncbi:hypothetical protein ABKN59_003665 [Abortiporus biennis]
MDARPLNERTSGLLKSRRWKYYQEERTSRFTRHLPLQSSGGSVLGGRTVVYGLVETFSAPAAKSSALCDSDSQHPTVSHHLRSTLATSKVASMF